MTLGKNLILDSSAADQGGEIKAISCSRGLIKQIFLITRARWAERMGYERKSGSQLESIIEGAVPGPQTRNSKKGIQNRIS